MAIGAELYVRIKRFADAEGISVDAFVSRCVEEIVGYREAAERELDGQEAGDPVQPQDATRADWDSLSNAQKLAELRRQTVEGMRAFLAQPDPRKAERAEAARLEREERERQRAAERRSQDAFKAYVLGGR